MMDRLIEQNWYIMQDVNDICEELELYKGEEFLTEQGPQVS